jgi:hypothetical protein
MVNFLLFILASVGFSHILVESTICDPIRTWFNNRSPQPDQKITYFSWICGKISYILSCYQCSGVWAGWIMGLFLLTTWNIDVSILYNILLNICIIIPAGFAASIVSNFSAVLLTYMESYLK